MLIISSDISFCLNDDSHVKYDHAWLITAHPDGEGETWLMVDDHFGLMVACSEAKEPGTIQGISKDVPPEFNILITSSAQDPRAK